MREKCNYYILRVINDDERVKTVILNELLSPASDTINIFSAGGIPLCVYCHHFQLWLQIKATTTP